MDPNDLDNLSADEVLKRSQELRDQFAALTRVMETIGFPIGDDALATAGLSRPKLHHLYSAEEGVAAFAEGPADWLCDGQFALLPAWVLGFFTVGDAAVGSFVDDPKGVHWRPGRMDYEPDDEQPWLPRAVREPLGPDGQPHHDYALFLRRGGDDRYLYAGLAGLGGWANPLRPMANFFLRQRLPREAWERFGGWPGWWGGVGRQRVRLALGDVAELERLLTDLGPNDPISLTRYEGDVLSVYLNADRGHVRYDEPNGRESRVAHDPSIPGDSQGEVEFAGDPEPWTMPLRETIPRTAAVAAVVEFFRTGQPPTCVGEPAPPPPPPPPGPRIGLHNEAEWLAETSPDRLLISIYPDPRFDVLRRLGGRNQASLPRLDDRKMCLLAVACCRRVWHLMTDERSRRMIEVIERWAEGQATDEERAEAGAAAHQAFVEGSNYSWGRDEAADRAQRVRQATLAAGAEFARGEEQFQPGMRASAVTTMVLIETARAVNPDYQNSPERPVQADLIRCLAGNPFRPVTIHPDSRTPMIVALAEEIYARRAWERLPILADALEETGLADADALAHCRGGGPHSRGCWVVDGLLGRGPDGASS